jgi:hypothetical protein
MSKDSLILQNHADDAETEEVETLVIGAGPVSHSYVLVQANENRLVLAQLRGSSSLGAHSFF